MITQDRTTISQAVAERLFDAEAKLDDAVETLSSLIQEATAARRAAGLGLNVGADALADASRALADLASARQKLAASHKGFAVVRRALGVQIDMVGGGDKTFLAQPAPLKEVA